MSLEMVLVNTGSKLGLVRVEPLPATLASHVGAISCAAFLFPILLPAGGLERAAKNDPGALAPALNVKVRDGTPGSWICLAQSGSLLLPEKWTSKWKTSLPLSVMLTFR